MNTERVPPSSSPIWKAILPVGILTLAVGALGGWLQNSLEKRPVSTSAAGTKR